MCFLKKYFSGLVIVAISIGLVFSPTFSKAEFQGEYERQNALKENYLQLFWAYNDGTGWADNVLVTRDAEVLFAENFDDNELNEDRWEAQLPEDIYKVENGELFVDKKVHNITGILAKVTFEPPFTLDVDLKCQAAHTRASLLNEASAQGLMADWATELSVGQDGGAGGVGVFSGGWIVLGNLPLEEYHHYRASVLDENKVEVVITEGPGEPVKIAVEPASKLTSAWGKIKLTSREQ